MDIKKISYDVILATSHDNPLPLIAFRDQYLSGADYFSKKEARELAGHLDWSFMGIRLDRAEIRALRDAFTTWLENNE